MIFFKDSKLLDQNGNPEVLWHGSRTNTLKEFDFKYEGTGVESMDGSFLEVTKKGLNIIAMA